MTDKALRDQILAARRQTEPPIISVWIPDVTTWHYNSDAVAVRVDDIRAAAAILACCDVALVAADDNQPVEGPTYCRLMTQVSHVRGILSNITRRYYEGDVLPDDESSSLIPGTGNQQDGATSQE